MSDNRDDHMNPSPAQAARESFSGKRLTEAQFDKSWALSGVIEREIRRSGSFREALTDYSHAFARSEKFDALQGETILRDVFKARYGQSMNQMREDLLAREAQVRETAEPQALSHARGIEPLIRDGDTMPFYRAYDTQANRMSRDLRVSENGAKVMMKEAYNKAEGRDLYATGKALEEQHHVPKREAERVARAQERTRTPERSYART